MATVQNVNNASNVATQTIVDAADVTKQPDLGQFVYNYNDGGGIDIDFQSADSVPATSDQIYLADDGTGQQTQNYLITAAAYAANFTAL